MILQGALQFESLSRRTDPPSSKEAARKMVETGGVESHEEIIVSLVRSYPGRTSKELAGLGPLDRVAIARRLKKMEDKGILRRTQQGKEECRWWAV